MSARDGSGNEEPKTEPASPARIMAARAEWLKYTGKYGARDCAAVMYFDSHLLLVPRHAETNRRARCAVLNGVGGEVRDGLEDAMFVPRADAINVAFKRDLAVPRLRLDLL